MNRGKNRRDIFHEEEDYLWFIALVAELPERFALRIHGFALMPNHYHLMVESLRPELSRAVQHLQSSFTRRINRRTGGDGGSFKGRFRNRVVEDDAYWTHLLAYLHLNPVRARLVARTEDWRWTSHDAYARRSPAPDWLTTGGLLASYDIHGGYARYLASVRLGRESGPDGFDPDRLWTAHRSADVPEPPPPPREAMSAEQALEAAAAVTGFSNADLVVGRRGRTGHPARWVAMWWLVRATDLSRIEVARLFGTSPATITRSLTRVLERRPKDGELEAWMTALAGDNS